MQKHSLKH